MEGLNILIERMNNNMIKGFQEMKKEIKKKEEKWEKEKADLEKKMGNLETKVEMLEKRNKNSTVITGLVTDVNTKESVENFIQTKLGVNPNIKTAYKIGNKERRRAIQ
ncbi:hypothetical protein ILUMI_00225 [Ignelater luminosus]|uniref:Uncharacterized protein n=1 Tax=Ignelater luminosus TaxID=2038154 RepID=A0A8K0GLG1_IGNLU|nr:hypothetical protein ILUMI_00225 [Ignelater luminosus]